MSASTTALKQRAPVASMRAPNAGLLIGILFAALLLLILASLTIGRYPVPLKDVARVIFTTSPLNALRDSSDESWIVIEIVRLPRILMVTLCGMGLALAGATMQGVFRNPLVEPGIGGVTPGASVGGILAIILAFNFWGVVAMAFAGGLLALASMFLLAQIVGKSSILSLVLSGVIISAFLGSVVGLLISLADPSSNLPAIMFWLLGSFAGATYSKLLVLAVVSCGAAIPLLLLRWRINVLSLDESDAKALGVPVAALRWLTMTLVAILVASQVAVSGGISWVGLIVPHLARMLIGADHKNLLPVSALLGSIYLLAMDDLARTIGSQEIPLGLLTTAFGVPVFGYLFWRNRGKGWGNA